MTLLAEFMNFKKTWFSSFLGKNNKKFDHFLFRNKDLEKVKKIISFKFTPFPK